MPESPVSAYRFTIARRHDVPGIIGGPYRSAQQFGHRITRKRLPLAPEALAAYGLIPNLHLHRQHVEIMLSHGLVARAVKYMGKCDMRDREDDELSIMMSDFKDSN